MKDEMLSLKRAKNLHRPEESNRFSAVEARMK